MCARAYVHACVCVCVYVCVRALTHTRHMRQVLQETANAVAVSTQFSTQGTGGLLNTAQAFAEQVRVMDTKYSNSGFWPGKIIGVGGGG